MLQAPQGRLIRLLISHAAAMILALFAAVTSIPAQDNPTPASTAQVTSSNRFLFIVDISAPMQKHIQETVDTVETVLRSSASGQLHNGDTIGVWAFNDDVYTGTMPLETWSPDNSDEITLRIAEFIRQQDYGKQSRLDIVMKPVAKVVKMSDIITVFIISSGAGPISGTPYDDDINAQYKSCLQDMGKKPMPIVTVLQGKRGKLIRYTVNALPWPVVIPEIPITLKLPGQEPAALAPAQAEVPAVAQSAANPPAAAPAPAQQAQPVPPSAPVTPAAPPPVVVPPMVVRPPASVASTGPPPAIPPQFAPQPSPAPVANTVPPPAPPAEVTAPAPTPTPAPAPVPVVAPPVAQTASAAPARPAEPVVRPPTSDQLPLVPPRQPPLVPKTLPANAVLSAPAASSPIPAPAPAPAAAVQAPPKTLVAQATALIKSYTGAHRNLLLIGGISLLVVASALILLMARRSRPSGRISLISQTMNDQGR